ncbi:hypothetical protein J6590_010764 [Homalodisca vitripennis]|nr:hypothetical protein J6590_010764 [Homalodisca vitripennis]
MLYSREIVSINQIALVSQIDCCKQASDALGNFNLLPLETASQIVYVKYCFEGCFSCFTRSAGWRPPKPALRARPRGISDQYISDRGVSARQTPAGALVSPAHALPCVS